VLELLISSTKLESVQVGFHTMAFELSPLPYNYDALEPYIDAQTMQLHHYAPSDLYVLNTAVGKYSELEAKSGRIVTSLDSLPADILSAVA